MEEKLVDNLAKCLEAASANRRELDRMRKLRKRKRWDGFSDNQRRIALVLYVMADFAMKPVVFYLLQTIGIFVSSAMTQLTCSLWLRIGFFCVLTLKWSNSLM